MPMQASTTHDASLNDGTEKKPASRAALKAVETARNFDHLADAANIDVHVVALIRDRSIASTWRDAAKGLIPAPRKFGSATKWNVGELRRAMTAKA
jgi:hypothetical protein